MRINTAARDRAAQPGVAYGDVKFTSPYDQDVQALQRETAEKWGWSAADYFRATYELNGILSQVLQDLGMPNAIFAGAALAGPLGVMTALFAEGKGFQPADFEEYNLKLDAIKEKYGPLAGTVEVSGSANDDAIDADFTEVPNPNVVTLSPASPADVSVN